MAKFLYEDLTYRIIGCAIEVHKYLGPGFLEADVRYKDITFEKRFKADIIVDGKILIELKAIKKLTENDEAQLLN